MIGRDKIREGMTVRSTDGTKLGKVVALGDSAFEIEKGLFFKDQYAARYADVSEIQGDEIFVDLTSAPGYSSASTTGYETTGYETTGTRTSTENEEARVPLAEERLEVDKRQREAGELRARKTVETEYQSVSVPVRKEEVHVERVPVSASSPTAGEATFEEESYRIPLREEEVEVRKRPVVREEVRITKGAHEESREVGGEVRKERLDVTETGETTRGWGTEPPER